MNLSLKFLADLLSIDPCKILSAKKYLNETEVTYVTDTYKYDVLGDTSAVKTVKVKL